MESLKKSGFGGAKMYTKDDLKDMSPEGMAEKVNIHYRHEAAAILK